MNWLTRLSVWTVTPKKSDSSRAVFFIWSATLWSALGGFSLGLHAARKDFDTLGLTACVAFLVLGLLNAIQATRWHLRSLSKPQPQKNVVREKILHLDD
jgi:hypothetical protein